MYFHTINLTRYRKRVLHQTKMERKTFVFSLEKTSVRETIAKINHCFFKNKKNMYKNVDDFLQFLQLLSSIENNGWTV